MCMGNELKDRLKVFEKKTKEKILFFGHLLQSVYRCFSLQKLVFQIPGQKPLMSLVSGRIGKKLYDNSMDSSRQFK
jgi:hypothetical protein